MANFQRKLDGHEKELIEHLLNREAKQKKKHMIRFIINYVRRIKLFKPSHDNYTRGPKSSHLKPYQNIIRNTL